MVSSLPPPLSQFVTTKLTRAAIFMVVTINPGPGPQATIRGLCADLSSLLRGVGFRDLEGQLSCVMGFGSDAWDRLFGAPRPKDLHPFREIRGVHHAVSTPGDILFHIRAARMDLCFELATQIMSRLAGAVSTVDEVHGFKLFRRPRPDRLRRRHRKPGGSGAHQRPPSSARRMPPSPAAAT